MPTNADTLRALGYTCREAAPIADEDGDPVPMFIIRDASGQQVAYGISEKIAWDAAVEMLRYRGMTPNK